MKRRPALTFRRRTRGYTAVELMMALAVFATGVTGIIAMERATVSSNQFAKNLTVADAVAQSWLTQLNIDGRLWTGVPTPGLGSTLWLSTASGAWQLPGYNAALNFGAQFDAFGAPVGPGVSGFFCVHVRLTSLFTGASALDASGNGLMRTEVRVFWPRDGVTRIPGDCVNPGAGTVAAVGAANGLYHFVYYATTVRQPKL